MSRQKAGFSAHFHTRVPGRDELIIYPSPVTASQTRLQQSSWIQSEVESALFWACGTSGSILNRRGVTTLSATDADGPALRFS